MRKIGKITYNGKSSADLGVIVSGEGTFDAAALDYTSYQVPGRNGDLILSNNRYSNITVTYPAFTVEDLEETAQKIRNWMRSARSYARIEDNYDLLHYRMGMGKDVFPFSPAPENQGANMKLVFDCKPQRYLYSGEQEHTFETQISLFNPTQEDARPLIRVTNPRTGAKITIGSQVLTCSRSHTGVVIIDCDIQNIYDGASNLNSDWSGEFPVIKPGVNSISSSGVDAASIIPRWWEL